MYFPKTMATKSPTCSYDVMLTLLPSRDGVLRSLPLNLNRLATIVTVTVCSF